MLKFAAAALLGYVAYRAYLRSRPPAPTITGGLLTAPTPQETWLRGY